MSQFVRPRTQIDGIGIGIIILTLITAIAHLYLGFKTDEELHTWFLLNGLGYLGLLVAFFLPQLAQYHSLIRWALLGYTLLTIILWFFLGGVSHGELDPFDVTVKMVEAALVILLFIDSRRDTRQLAL
jgi:hypothetical protein